MLLGGLPFGIALFAAALAADRYFSATDEARIVVVAQLIAIAFATRFVEIALHEFGHLACGLAMGFTIEEVQISRLRFSPKSGRWRGTFDARRALYSGYVKGWPKSTAWFRIRWAIFILGGPATVLAVAYAILSFSANAYDAPTSPIVFYHETILWLDRLDFFIQPKSSVLAGLNFAASILLFSSIYNLLPIDHTGSDGSQLLDIVRIKDPQVVFQVTKIAGELVETRPREWSPDQIKRLADLREQSGDNPSCDLLLYYHFLDAERFDEAFYHLESALERVGNRTDRPSVLLEAAYFHGRHRNEGTIAANYLDRAGKHPGRHLQTYLRAQAAVHFAMKEFEQARDTAWEAVKATRTAFDIGGAVAEREWLARLAMEAEAERVKARGLSTE